MSKDNDFYGTIAGQKHWFVGVVKDTNDPNNRVRVQIKGIHPEDAGSSTTVTQTASINPTGGTTTGGTSTGGTSGSTSGQAGTVSVSKDNLPSSSQLSAPLSPHFTLGSLVLGRHRQFTNQLTPTIIYNLKNLAVNCLEPLKAQYPGMIVTCGWREQGSINHNQNHPNGYACDFVVPGHSPAAVCSWIKQNLRGRYNLLEQATRHVHIQLGGSSRQGTTSNPVHTTGASA